MIESMTIPRSIIEADRALKIGEAAAATAIEFTAVPLSELPLPTESPSMTTYATPYPTHDARTNDGDTEYDHASRD